MPEPSPPTRSKHMSALNARLSAIRGFWAPRTDLATPRESCSCDCIYTRWCRAAAQSAHQALSSFTILRDASKAARLRGGCLVALEGAVQAPGCFKTPRTALLIVSGCVHLATAACFAAQWPPRPPARQLRQLRSIPPASARCTLQPSHLDAWGYLSPLL